MKNSLLAIFDEIYPVLKWSLANFLSSNFSSNVLHNIRKCHKNGSFSPNYV